MDVGVNDFSVTSGNIVALGPHIENRSSIVGRVVKTLMDSSIRKEARDSSGF